MAPALVLYRHAPHVRQRPNSRQDPDATAGTGLGQHCHWRQASRENAASRYATFNWQRSARLLASDVPFEWTSILPSAEKLD
jgi:hypothetical protein